MVNTFVSFGISEGLGKAIELPRGEAGASIESENTNKAVKKWSIALKMRTSLYSSEI